MSGLTRTSFGLRVSGPALTAPVPTMAKIDANSSASQHKTFDRCRRLWFFEKVAGVKQLREAKHFIIGHSLHAVADRYLTGEVTSWEALYPAATATTSAWNDGLDEYESNWIRSITKKAVEEGVWQATPGSHVEYALAFLVGPEFVDQRGLPLLAKADTYIDEHRVRRVAKLTTLYDGRPLPLGWDALPPYVGFIDHMILTSDPPEIKDHKTAKHRGYALTSAKLAEDLQVLSYSAVPLVLRPDVDVVKITHNVFLKNPDAPTPVYKVSAEAPLAKVQATWAHILSNTLDMQLIREVAPKIKDASNPYIRANNWQLVKSAIEEGRAKEACSCYGGCPFRDVCFGRATAEQVVRRMDSPDPMALVKRDAPKPEPTFGLRGRPAPSPSQPYSAPSRFVPKLSPDLSPLFPNNPTPAQSRPQELSMPFAAKPISTNQDAYIVDPEDATTQYRVRVGKILDNGTDVELALYPNPDVVPNFETLGTQYRITVPASSVITLPHVTAKVKGYQEVAKGLGITEGLDWTPAQVAPAPTITPTAKPHDKPARDGAFGLKGAPVAAPVPAAAPVTALEPLPPGTPAWGLQGVADGTQLRVKQTNHAFWSKLVGKIATVNATAPGDLPGSTSLSVTIEGHPYPDVNAHRFEPIVASTHVLDRPEAALVGHQVSIRLHSSAVPYNCVLGMVSADGITFMEGKMSAAWSDVKSIEPMSADKIPGAPPTAEQKAAAKAAAKAEKAAVKAAEKAALEVVKRDQGMSGGFADLSPAEKGQQAVPGTEGVPTIEPAQALQNAIEAVNAVLNGGKVTRKALEGIVPLLAAAQVHQTNLESGAPAVPAAAPAAPQVSGLVRVAIDHAISTLNDAKAKLG